jgi:hypothetical protein
MAEPDNFGIIRRFTFIREQISAGKVLTAREAREYLASAVRTPLSEIDEHSCLAQEVTYEETEKGTRTKIKSVNRLEALKLDADLGGYALHASQEKTPMRLRLIASSSGDAASIAAEIDGI